MIHNKITNPVLTRPGTVDDLISSIAFFHGDLSKPGLQVIFGAGNDVFAILDRRTVEGRVGFPAFTNPGRTKPTFVTGTFNGFDEIFFDNDSFLICDQQMPGDKMSFYLVIRDIAGQTTNPTFGGPVIRGNGFVWGINSGNMLVNQGFLNLNNPGLGDGVYSLTMPSPFNVSGPVRLRKDGVLSGTGTATWATSPLSPTILGNLNVKMRIGELILIAGEDAESTYLHKIITNHLVKKWFQ